MIPQTTTPWAGPVAIGTLPASGTYLKIRARLEKDGVVILGNAQSDALYIPLAVNWERNRKYTYTIEFNGLNALTPITFSVTAQDWDDVEKQIPEEEPLYVDLGLPSGLKWARGNIIEDGDGYTIGQETEYGAYVSWGNVEPHFSSDGQRFDDNYNWGMSNTLSPIYKKSPGCTIPFTSQHRNADYSADSGHDAARELLGGAWRMPSANEFKELYDNCTSAWITKDGINGREFTSNINGAKVFFPAAGCGYSTLLYYRGTQGLYWSSSLNDDYYAYFLDFSRTYLYCGNNTYRYLGLSVRAVLDTSETSKAATVTDLSMVDNSGNARATMTTANCYLVHSAGKYKLPLVYGNAIKNGTVNTVAFNPGGTTTSTYCSNFVNHNNDDITGPWITKNGSGIDAGMNIPVDGAQLIWQDAEGLVSDIAVHGDYLTFTVSDFAEGNAVIAAKSGSDIVWSWHIWVTAETLENTTIVATGSHNYTVAPVNLGWVPTGGEGKLGYCPYYQWGRKDPFFPCNGTANGNTNKTIYNISGANITPASITASSIGIQYESSTSATIATNIQNPIKHYYNSSNYGPCNTTYYNMWDAQNTATNNVTSATKKTIYDPCPPGFCVPTGNLWYYLGNGSSCSDSNWDSTNKGKTWTLNGASIYFPAAGYRNYSSGALSGVGSYGYYWSATPGSTSNGRNLYFYSSNWNWTFNGRANGFAVRPVAEE